MNTTSVRAKAATLLIGAALAMAACGSDSPSSANTSNTGPVDAGTSPSTTIEVVTELPELTGAQICAAVDAATVSAALGLQITEARPDDSATPQCAYIYTAPSGASSNLTIAQMRSTEELGGRTDKDAFTYVVGLNQGAPGEVQLTDVDVAGNRTVHLTGAALHFGVMQVQSRIITVVLPVTDADGVAFEALLVAIAPKLAT